MQTQFGVFLPFQPRLWTFKTPTRLQLPKWEYTWESSGSIPCTLPHLWECVSHPNTLSWPHGPLCLALNRKPNFKVTTMWVNALGNQLRTYWMPWKRCMNFIDVSKQTQVHSSWNTSLKGEVMSWMPMPWSSFIWMFIHVANF
jgi:hypothetical protein